MRVSVPSIPKAILNATPAKAVRDLNEATQRLSAFLSNGNVTILTGAGVSVDSGIRAYRGDDGRYMNPNYKPIMYNELMDPTERGHSYRQRYWLRSYLGYPVVRDALPNTTHFALAALQYSSYISRMITQNVDGLHQKALWPAVNRRSPSPLHEDILELHGTLHRVHCNKGHVVDRNTFQDRLSAANPRWHAYALDVERAGTQPRTNPDGDVAIEHLGVNYGDFIVPDCPECLLKDHRNSLQKPEIIFFGESIPQAVKDRSFRDVESCDRLLVMGTTLATYSAFRLLRHALDIQKPVMLVNLGPTRADGLPGIEKLDVPTGAVIRDVARNVIGAKAQQDHMVAEMLRSGIVNPPLPDDDDRHPRGAGSRSKP